MNPKSILEKNLRNSIKAKQSFLQSLSILEEFNDAIKALFECYSKGGKLYLAGNGGSAADSQHLAAEFVSKLAFDREALPAEALSVDTSTITAIANDYGYEFIFSRQLEGLGNKNDVLISGHGSIIKNNFYRKLLNEALQFDLKNIKWIFSTTLKQQDWDNIIQPKPWNVKKTLRLVSVGRLSKDKNTIALIKALRKLCIYQAVLAERTTENSTSTFLRILSLIGIQTKRVG